MKEFTLHMGSGDKLYLVIFDDEKVEDLISSISITDRKALIGDPEGMQIKPSKNSPIKYYSLDFNDVVRISDYIGPTNRDRPEPPEPRLHKGF